MLALPRRYHLHVWQISIFVVFLIYGLSIRTAPVRIDRFFWERDPTLSYPLVSSQVPTWLLYFCSILFPFLYLFLGLYLSHKPNKPQLCFWWILGGLQTLFITISIFNTLKVSVGRLRPNFFALCDYQHYRDMMNGVDDSYWNLTSPMNVGNFDYCFASSGDEQDARKSFPSGHAAISFTGLFYACLIFRFFFIPKFGSAWISWRSFFSSLPVMLAVWISITRVQDYKHNVDDVIVGAIIGSGVAFACWANVLRVIEELGLHQQTPTPLHEADPV